MAIRQASLPHVIPSPRHTPHCPRLGPAVWPGKEPETALGSTLKAALLHETGWGLAHPVALQPYSPQEGYRMANPQVDAQ